MYDALTTAWDKVWADMKSLKLGVSVKGVSQELRACLDKLKTDVSTWQQYVGAYNGAKPEAQAPLQEKVKSGADIVLQESAACLGLLDKQIAANTSAPLGQFQLPKDGPAVTANPGLKTLAASLTSAQTALEIEMAGTGGAGSEPITLPVQEEELPPPSWLKTT